MAGSGQTWTPVRLLWVDSVGGLVVGVVVLVLRGALAGLHGLPLEVVTFLGATNVAYGSFSGALLRRARAGVFPVVGGKVLVAANATWPLVCVALAVAFRDDVSAFGLLHLLGEGAYVGGLAVVERRVFPRR